MPRESPPPALPSDRGPSTVGKGRRARPLFVRLMDALYLFCVVVAIGSVVSMTCLIFVGVIMRYIFYMGAAFAEPSSIFFAVQLTLYGAAACLRAKSHLRIQFFTGLLPKTLQWIADALVKVLMAAIALAMIYYGGDLVRTTWHQAYPEFAYIRVGAVYSAIPGGGLILLLFIIESVLYPDPMRADEDEEMRRAMAHAEDEARKLGY